MKLATASLLSLALACIAASPARAASPAATSTEGYIPPQTRKKKVDYGAFSASMTRGAADEFDDYD